ncbi:glycerate kinase [Microlunatus parietis]|uniref:Glycerate kinase n=1 Tax=Microlunatus parietis TaxID=682979 RepID=A0A7Y9I409_9ACTN|nr:glycerate kinase [Microlunatus parietis]NYE69866.1 glycerate kinase [Microlunatus parietis]
MRIVIAPDKFKGSLTAAEVARALADGLAGAGIETELVPVADGGEGTVEAAVSTGFRAVPVEVPGPLGEPVRARYAIGVPAGGGPETAVIELAAASGLDQLPRGADGRPEFSPLRASSAGTGALIRAALDAGCTELVLGVGGSANTDGGAGLLTELGARLLDPAGRPVPGGGGGLADLARVDLSGLDPRIANTRIVLAADVGNPLLGPSGAAAVFGPQKGATAADIEVLDRALAGYARLVAAALGADPEVLVSAPGAGAAGGVGFAALAVLGARMRPGIDLVCELVGLDRRLAGAAAVITGEGSLDSQSLSGKSPVGVARRARAAGVPRVYAVCGRNQLTADEAAGAGFDHVFALADREPDPDRSMRLAADLLRPIGREIGLALRG